MGCACSKEDVLEAPSTLKSKEAQLKSASPVRSQESHPSVLANKDKKFTPQASCSTPSNSPLKGHNPARPAACTPEVHHGITSSSPSTPSTLPCDEDEHDRGEEQWSDEDDDDPGVDQSDHIESDDEFRRFTEIKDDLQEDLKKINKLEKEVQQESIQLIKDLDSSHEPLGPAPPPPAPPIKVLVTGDDAPYLLKILRLTHGPPLTNRELVFYRDCVRANVVQDMRVLCTQLREADFDTLLAFSEEEATTPDIFDTLSAFGQLRHVWQDIRTHGFDGGTATKASKSWDGSDLTVDGESRITPRRAFDILLTVLVEDEEAETTLESEVPDVFEEEKVEQDDTKLFLNLWREIQVLWQSEELKEFLSERPWLLHDSLLFHLSYLEDLDRIASPDYCVTGEDIVDSCSDDAAMESMLYRTNGVDFQLSTVPLDDVLRCQYDAIDELTSLLIFAASLTSFDQTTGSDGVNKMTRSLEAFQLLCSSEKLRFSTPRVVLTKHDLFVEKMSYSDVAAIADFDDYEGRLRDCNEALSYFSGKFLSSLGHLESNDSEVHVFDSSDSDVTSILLEASKKLPRIRFTFSRASSTEEPIAEPEVSPHQICQDACNLKEEGVEYIEI